MGDKQKVLVCGDVEGKFNALFNKVASINKKSGPYEVLLCVGNFFGVNNQEFDAYKSGKKIVAVPTYILGPNKEEHIDLYPIDECELCPNVNYLGKRGTFTSSGKLKIAYLSGVQKAVDDKSSYGFNRNDVDTLRDVCIRGNANYKGVDILITSVWPKDVKNLDCNANKNDPKPILNDSALISSLALEIKPRYHFSGIEGEFYERPPYRNMNSFGNVEVATRFIALARIDNPQKQKWIQALSLTPVDSMRIEEILQQTTDETKCPYDPKTLSGGGNKSKEDEGKQYFYDMNAGQNEKRKHNPKHEENKRPKFTIDQERCWFCLQSPKVEKHLVISVGNEVYLALAKGGLVDQHLLILPIEHHQSSIKLPETVTDEVQQFKTALKQYFRETDNETVFFERNYKTAHMQIQAVPVPKHTVTNCRNVFEEAADGYGFKLSELEAHNRLDQVIPSGAPFFCVELPSGELLYTRVKTGFPLQFAREALASSDVLNVSDRIDWRVQSMDQSEEVALVKSIRKKFVKYDFTDK